MKKTKLLSILSILTLTGVLSACQNGQGSSSSSSFMSSLSSTSLSTSKSSSSSVSSSESVSSSSESVSSSSSESVSSSTSESSSSSSSTSIDTTIHVTSLNIDKDKVTLEEGQKETITVEVLPVNATDASYQFAVGDPTIASISETGEILGIKEGTTTITASSNDGHFEDSVIVTVYHSYKITTNAPAGVSITTKDKAKEGDLVFVELQYDETALSVNKVLANSIEMGTSNGKYYFYMPKEDVEITVEVSPIYTYYKVITSQSNIVHLNTTGAYKAGDSVDISFSVLPGYQFDGEVKVYKNLNAFDPNDRLIVESTFINGVISFVMPSEDVEIVVSVSASTFTMAKEDKFSHIYNIKAGDSNATRFGDLYEAKFNQTVTITFYSDTNSSFDKAKPSAVYIPEMDLTLPVEGNSVEFVMPHFDVTIRVLTTPVYRNITLNGSEHISISAYTKVDDQYVLITDNKAVYGDTVYLKLTSMDEEMYQLRSLKGSYVQQGYSYTSDLKLTTVTEGDVTYYSFEMPKVGFDSSVEINVVEKNMTLFVDAPFVGSYLGVELYSGRSNVTKFDSSRNTTIDTSGLLIQGVGSSSEKEVTIDSYDDMTSMMNITTSEGKAGKGFFKDNLYASNWSYNGETLVTSDMVFLIKKQSPSDEDSLYSFNGVFVDSSYYFGQINRDGVPYLTFAADAKNQTIITNVTFEFTTGEAVTDSNAEYSVVANDISLYHVKDKKVSAYDGLQGTYTNADSKELVLDGTGNATYDGNSYSYKITDGKNIKLQRVVGESIEILEITLEGNNFIITSSVTEGLAPVYQRNFYGKTSYNYYIHFIFDRADKCRVYVDYDPDLSGSATSSTFGYDGDATYTYDSSTSTLVVNTIEGSATFTLSGEAGSYVLTCVSSNISFYGGAVNADFTYNEFIAQ